MNRPKTAKILPHSEQSLVAAKNFISSFNQVPCPTEAQKILLAAAHHTLSHAPSLSPALSKMHTNASITLLQNIRNKNKSWASHIAQAYFKRAEQFEKDQSFQSATFDYERAILVLEHYSARSVLTDPEKLLLAESALSLADILLHQRIEIQHLNKPFPLHYINKALEYLARIPKEENIYPVLAFAHKLAGSVFCESSSKDLLEAAESFRTALAMAFKSDPKQASQLLEDIYLNLGMLFEERDNPCIRLKSESHFQDYAEVYFTIAEFFKASVSQKTEDFSGILNSLLDIIYHALDPFLSPISITVLRDLIDALIFMYYCLLDDIFPKTNINQKLSEPDILATLAQHIYWLVAEEFHRENPNSRILELADPRRVDIRLDMGDILNAVLFSKKNNVINFPIPTFGD